RQKHNRDSSRHRWKTKSKSPPCHAKQRDRGGALWWLVVTAVSKQYRGQGCRMRKAIYNSAIPQANLKSVNRSSCSASRLGSALLVLLLSTAVFAADWGTAEQQLAKKIIAVTGPGTLSLTVENRSSMGRRDSDLVQNGLRSALEQSGIHFAKNDQAAASVALTLSENESSYVWVAQIQQGAGESAVAMVSVPRSGRSGAAYESMPITLRKVSLWAQDERIL